MTAMMIAFLVSVAFIVYNILSLIMGTPVPVFHIIALIIFIVVGVIELISIIKERKED